MSTLSYGTHHNTGKRCTFEIAVFIEGDLPVEVLSSQYQAYCAKYPLLWGSLDKTMFHIPQWKYSDEKNANRPIYIGYNALPDNAAMSDILRCIERLANKYSAHNGWMTALDIIKIGTINTIMLFSFDHLLFDASGAEAFIVNYYRQVNGEPCVSNVAAIADSELYNAGTWLKRLVNLRKIKNMMRRVRGGNTICMPLPKNASQYAFRFRVAIFNEEESNIIKENAFRTAGYMMLTPFAVATAASALRSSLCSRAESEDKYAVVVPTNKPKGATRKPHCFFNSLSFLFFRFPASSADNRDDLARTLSEQMMSQIREGVPAAIEDTNLLMRALPVRLLWRLLLVLSQKCLASFVFSCPGDTTISTKTVLGCRVYDRIHFPINPTPPGFGFILHQSGGAYRAVFSYLEEILPEGIIDELMDSFRRQLLDAPSHPS